MHAPQFGELRLSQLQWLVVPAVRCGQVLVGHSLGRSGHPAPSAVLIWASISDDLDEALRQNADKREILRSLSWQGGSNIWIIAAAGPADQIKKLVALLKRQYPEKEMTTLIWLPDGIILHSALSRDGNAVS